MSSTDTNGRASGPLQSGVALMSVLMAMVLLMALGAGSMLATSTEMRIAAVYRRGPEAFHAAEAGLAIVLGELEALRDWTEVLSGATSSPLSDGPSVGPRALPDGRLLDLARETNLLRCGRASPCTERRMDARTLDRPWGRNNPRWQAYLHAPLGDLLGEQEADPRVYVVVWVADDPAESDGDPLRDGDGEGLGRLLVRARGYGPGRVARTVEVVAVRAGVTGGPGKFRILTWYETW